MTTELERLLDALQKGPIRAIGLAVYDSDMVYMYQTITLKEAIDELHRTSLTLRVGRIDAGGTPTWDLK